MACDSTFNLTETNLFKQLTHLSLRFRAGNDAAVKKYLATRLSSLKATVAELESSFAVVSLNFVESLADISLAQASESLELSQRECSGYSQQRATIEGEYSQILQDLKAFHQLYFIQVRKIIIIPVQLDHRQRMSQQW